MKLLANAHLSLKMKFVKLICAERLFTKVAVTKFLQSINTHTHTLLGSSMLTSRPVTEQARVRALLKVQSFTDDQAVTVLHGREDGVCGV